MRPRGRGKSGPAARGAWSGLLPAPPAPTPAPPARAALAETPAVASLAAAALGAMFLVAAAASAAAPPARPAPATTAAGARALPLAAAELRLETTGGRLQATARLVFAPGAGEPVFLLGRRFGITAVRCGGRDVAWRGIAPAEAAGLFAAPLTGAAAGTGADSALAGTVQVVALAAPPRPAAAAAATDTFEVRYCGPLPDPGPWELRLRPGDLFHPLSPGAAVAWTLRLPDATPARLAGPAPARPEPGGGAVLAPLRPLPAFALYATRADSVPWREVAGVSVACLGADGRPAAEAAWARLAHALALATADWGPYPWPCLATVEDGPPGGRPRSLAGLITNLPPAGAEEPFTGAGASGGADVRAGADVSAGDAGAVADPAGEAGTTATLLHEVLHGWFGLAVPTDPERGDWSEGLCALLADHDRRAVHNPRWAAELRRQILRRYAAVAGTPADVPLALWRPESGVPDVGYGKGLFFWLTLRRWLGEPTFRTALRAFLASRLGRPTGWGPLRAAFLDQLPERNRGEAATFFDAWLERPGAPRLTVTAAEWRPLAREARVVLRQEAAAGAGVAASPWPLWVTVRFEGLSSPPFAALMREVEQVLRCPVPLQVGTVTVDPDAEAFRLLETDEPLSARVRLAGR